MRDDGHRGELVCDVLREQGVRITPRSYRAWKCRPPSNRSIDDAAITAQLRQLRECDARGRQSPDVLYGRRKMTAWLARSGFPGISKHTVDRSMSDEQMNALVRGRNTRTTIPGKNPVRAGDRVNRDISCPHPNQVWVTDFTYVATTAGIQARSEFIYVAFDLHSRMIVGWAISRVRDTRFVE